MRKQIMFPPKCRQLAPLHSSRKHCRAQCGRLAIAYVYRMKIFLLGLLILPYQDWEDDVRRFKHIFRHQSDTELVVIIGNHDIGFHHE